MSFKDIKGQDKTVQILKTDLKTSKFCGAYLFIGEEGIGKHLAARNFAKAVNCLNSKDDACDNCISCIKIEKQEHPDVHFIGQIDSDAIKIESIRQLKKDIGLKPYEAKKKVFIINDAHNLTAEAANALLKVLEEPPRDSIIILITSKPALLFKTVVSRCKIIRFYPLKRLQLVEILKKDYSLDDNLAHFLAYFCEGRIGKAIRLKDTDIFREKNTTINAFLLSRNLNLEDISIQNKDNLLSQLNILSTWFRDMYLIKIGMPHAQLINLDRKDELLKYMNRYTLFDIDQMLKIISDSALYLEQNVNFKLLISNLKAELWKG